MNALFQRISETLVAARIYYRNSSCYYETGKVLAPDRRSTEIFSEDGPHR